MVEVFKTNVADSCDAKMLIDQIHQNFTGYKANFDLEDCDKILRVKSFAGPVQPNLLIYLLNKYGYYAELLADNVPLLMKPHKGDGLN